MSHITYQSMYNFIRDGNRYKQQSMDIYAMSTTCEACQLHDSKSNCRLCSQCLDHDIDSSLLTLYHRLNIYQDMNRNLQLICYNCSKKTQYASFYVKNDMIGKECCSSLDCKIMFERCRVIKRIEDYETAIKSVDKL